MKNSNSVRRLAFCALIAALYAALTMALGFISYNGLQFRVAEALCVLPFFFPCTTWALFVGCVLANLISPAGLLDVVFGSLATLLCCLAVQALGRGQDGKSWLRCILACACPVVFNGVIVGAVLAWTGISGGDSAPFALLMATYGAQVAFGELVVMFTLGLLLMRWLPGSMLYAMVKEKIG